jgi:NAD(P)-dependent dehydrogenase (short-subunit alcohol dehydrogenase family)
MDPRGKTALITGGAHRVGGEISLALAEAGSNLIIHYNSSEEAALETAAKARELGAEVHILEADLSDPLRRCQP